MTFFTHGSPRKVFEPFLVLKEFELRVHSVLDFLVFSSLYLAFECVAMAYVSCYIQQIAWSPECIVIPFLIAFAIYNLNRKTDEDEDAINREDRYSFTKRYEKALIGISLAGIGISLLLSALHSLWAVLVTLIPFIIGTLYSVRWLPAGLPYRRLKEIPFVKNIMVGLAWSFFLALLPVTLTGSTPDIRTLIMCLLFFFWGIMASTIPDIRDRPGDERTGVRTIPVIFGEKRTKGLLTSLNLAFALPILVLGFGALPLLRAAVLVATNLYSQGCIRLIGILPSTDFICDILADGQYIFFAFGIFVLRSAHILL
ncbi:MAG TPA: UbiA family prenyltransferase [Methanomicrobiales archaeon]|nr:UbiA family prenyltransferase [Methanomicrobiales archaeon]